MHHNFLSRCLMTAMTVGIVGAAQADTKLTYTDTGFAPQERQTIIQIHGDKVRMGEVGSDIYSLFDNTKKTLYTINTKTKQFIETTPDKTRERMTKVVEMQNQFKEEMKKQMASMPEDQRKQVEARIQQSEAALKAPPPAIKMEKPNAKKPFKAWNAVFPRSKWMTKPCVMCASLPAAWTRLTTKCSLACLNTWTALQQNRRKHKAQPHRAKDQPVYTAKV